MIRIAMLFAAMASPLLADDYLCEGSEPDWNLSITGDTAIFDFERKNTFNIPDTAIAEGKDWPRAMPLIGDFDTAVLVLDPGQCETGPYRAHILTQRGTTPLLLTGCCRMRK